jgi:hypothetical protein
VSSELKKSPPAFWLIVRLCHLLQESFLEMVRAEKLAGDGCSGGEGQVEVEVGMGMDGKGVTECRICQEEGKEAAMDSPCACTGAMDYHVVVPAETEMVWSASVLSVVCLLLFDFDRKTPFSSFVQATLQFTGFFLPCYVIARSCYALQHRKRRQVHFLFPTSPVDTTLPFDLLTRTSFCLTCKL